MSSDRSWMYARLNEHGYITNEFKVGVQGFINFAFSQPNIIYKGKIRCPCLRCKNFIFHDADIVSVHLCKKGFKSAYFV